MTRSGFSRLFGGLFLLLGAMTLAASLLTLGASAAPAAAPYANGFENPSDADSNALSDDSMHFVTRVASGTDGITSAAGSFHAVAAVGSGAFTRYGGYSNVFPAGGYTTSADFYLDTAASTPGADLRFDWSSAINNTNVAPTHRRDFVFNVGTNGTGGFVMSASNNAGRGNADPANAARSPYTISTSGWYTFQHRFYDSGGGVLAVELSVRTFGSSIPLHTWTLSDPTDVIGVTVGGNRYGLLASNELPLALDNVTRSGLAATCTPTGFFRDGINLTAAQIGGEVTGEFDATGCNIGVYYDTTHPATGTGVSGATIHGANYFGVLNNGTAVDVKSSTIRDIGEAPLNGAQHGNAVAYLAGASGTISGNAVSSYQKNGITVSGVNASASVLSNIVTGAGPVSYIAQNGIQISFGATALVRGNTVSRNWYTPADTEACGLLVFQATGVKQQMNNLFDNEVNFCNFGRGGGRTSP